MNDYNENSNVFDQLSNTETQPVEIVKQKEDYNIDLDESNYGVNKPSRIIIKAKISHDKD